MKVDFPYPLSRELTAPWSPPGAINFANLIKKYWPLSPRRGANNVAIFRTSGNDFHPLGRTDFPLIVITHNDRRLLPSFFRHYRSMGVTRFICVDDQSDDGSVAYLLAQTDVDLFASNVRYADADRGKIWREKLFALYGFDRWYLNVDSDEYFLFESIGSENVRDYAERLQRGGIKRLPAVMLDLYPRGDSSKAVFANGQSDLMPWDVASHFDGSGYSAQYFSTGLSCSGGIRSRAFGATGELMKYPLIFWDKYCSLGRTIHRPRPAAYNFAPALGAILHFKIFSDFKERAEHAVKEGQHYKGAKLYKNMANASGPIDLGYDHSIPYCGVSDLLERGFMLSAQQR